jgi:hypothetical protein
MTREGAPEFQAPPLFNDSLNGAFIEMMARARDRQKAYQS